MKNIIFVLVLLLYIVSSYSEQLVKTFQTGSGKGQIGYLYGENTSDNNIWQPSSIMIDNNDNLIIADSVNFRLLFFDDKFNYLYDVHDSVYFSASNYLDLKKNILHGAIGSRRHFFLNEHNKSVEIDFPNKISTDTKSYYFNGKVLLYKNKFGLFNSYILKDDIIMKFSDLLNHDSTMALFSKGNKYGLENYTIKDGYLYKNKTILIFEYADYHNYWAKVHTLNNLIPPLVEEAVPSFETVKKYWAYFVGIDDRNYYYFHVRWNKVLIFNNFGWPIEYIKTDGNVITSPVINDGGDIFFLKEASDNKDKFELVKVKRTW